jgi:putative tricarboxylic transport membrane protein
MTKKTFDFIFVAALTALSLYVGITAYRYPKTGIDQGYGPGIYPLILAVVIFLLAMVLLVTAIRRQDDERIKDLDLASLKKPAVFWVVLLLFCVSLKTLGVLLSGFLYLLISARFLFRVKWLHALITAVVVPLVIWVTFAVAMRVPLPTGTIWNVFR